MSNSMSNVMSFTSGVSVSNRFQRLLDNVSKTVNDQVSRVIPAAQKGIKVPAQGSAIAQVRLLDEAPAAVAKPAAPARRVPGIQDIRGGNGLLKKGDTGESVKTMQRLLTLAGFPVVDNGQFGNTTEGKLKHFQKRYGIQINGLLGKSTLRVLEKVAHGIREAKSLTPAQLASHGRHNKAAFFKALAPAAVESERKFGVPAEVTLAQAALESAWARSPIGGYNIFGIKGRGPAGSVNVATQEVYGGRRINIRDNFAKYHNFHEAVSEHGKLFHNGYYQRALDAFARSNNPADFVNAIHGVYATDPGYASKVNGIIRDYGLTDIVNDVTRL